MNEIEQLRQDVDIIIGELFGTRADMLAWRAKRLAALDAPSAPAEDIYVAMARKEREDTRKAKRVEAVAWDEDCIQKRAAELREAATEVAA
jgi:hypothetical protein